jgi:hypothetical protein
VNRCGFCGRENDEQSKFCIDCGKPVVKGGARVISVPAMGKHVDRPSSGDAVRAPKGIPDTRVSSAAGSKGGTVTVCPSCGKAADSALPFCPHCGARLDGGTAKRSSTATFTARGTGTGPKLSLLDETGEVKKTFTIDRGEATFGRSEGDIRFHEDVFLSPVHAQIAMRDGMLLVRDLGSRNGTWVFTDGPYRLQDGDTILIGSQLIRFRVWGRSHRARISRCSRSCARTAARATRCICHLRAASRSAATRAIGSFRTIRP